MSYAYARLETLTNTDYATLYVTFTGSNRVVSFVPANGAIYIYIISVDLSGKMIDHCLFHSELCCGHSR